MSALVLRMACPSAPELECEVDDDGDGARVAYAYLRERGRIVGDVWLYDRGETPERPEWKEPDARSRLPFKNSAEFVVAGPFPPIATASEVRIDWTRSPEGALGADVLIRGRLHARVQSGSKPGWCVLAAKDNAIARVLER